MLAFNKWGVGKKLVIGFVLVAIITVIVGLVGWYAENSLAESILQLKDESIPSIVYLRLSIYQFMRIKVAIRSLLSPDNFAAELEYQKKVIENARSEYAKAFSAYEAIPRTPEEEKLYQEAVKARTAAREVTDKILAQAQKVVANPQNAEALHRELRQLILGTERQTIDKTIDKLSELSAYVVDYYGVKVPEKDIRLGKQLNLIVILVSALGVVLAIGLGLLISRSITRPLNKTTEDLTGSSNNLEGAANQIASASQELSSGASELASSVEEITSSMEELQSIIESNTKSVNEAELLMKETAEGAKGSSLRSEELLAMMQEINERSRQVVRINKVIDDIAFQTSILALNAAVEAARAGEAGRGFAVVADQVKSLAQKSAEASNETSELIESVVANIEKGTERTRSVTEDSKKVSEAASKVSVLLDEITRAFKEQSKGANQVTKAISQVNTVVQQTASSSEETAAAAEQMQAQVEALREVVQTLNEVAQGKREGGGTSRISSALGPTRRASATGTGKALQRREEKREEAGSFERRENQGRKVPESKGPRGASSEVELITPEQKIPLEDFKDF
ncbi:MAG: methyl-accepting chemotaxis protein [Spirochaetales bacterium]